MEVSGNRRSNMTSALPIGYRFSPTDEEIIKHYLERRILNLPLPSNKVKELELYDHTPQQLEEKYGERKENEMYFFTQRKLNTATATRANRTIANAGYWRASTKKISIEDANKNVIGHKMLLNYYIKTDTTPDTMTSWLMYEYTTLSGSKKMDELVLCKLYDKKNEHKHKINKRPEKSYHNVEQAPYQADGVVLQTQNVALQAPIYQVYDVGLPDQNMEPQAPTYQDVSDVGLPDQNMKPQAPTYQDVSDVELHDQDMQMNFTMDSNACDHQAAVVDSIDYDLLKQHMEAESVEAIQKVLEGKSDPKAEAELIRLHLGPKYVENESFKMMDYQPPALQADYEPIIGADQHYSGSVAAYQYNSEDYDVRFEQYMELV